MEYWLREVVIIYDTKFQLRTTLGNCVCYLVFLYSLMHLKVTDIETNLSRVDLFRTYYENRKYGFRVI